MKRRLGQQRLLALFAAGLLLFNFPLLALWDVDARLLGLPCSRPRCFSSGRC